MTRDAILRALQRAAAENGGMPPGRGRFQQMTGFSEYDVNRHWARYGDLVAEAGFEPNTLKAAYSDDLLLRRLADVTRTHGRFPTSREIRVARSTDPTIPASNVFDRLGLKNERLSKLLDFCRANTEYTDLVPILEAGHVALPESSARDDRGTSDTSYGFVYLAQGHRGEYKIGRTNLVDRRLSELGATSSVEQKLIHEIKTDDPVGVEAYWHNRFKGKRMRGEWFKLSAADVKTFKRWRRIY